MGSSLAVVGGFLMFEVPQDAIFGNYLVFRLGGLLVTTGILGLCGLYKENRCALKVFSFHVVILCMVDLFFIILIYVSFEEFNCLDWLTANEWNDPLYSQHVNYSTEDVYSFSHQSSFLGNCSYVMHVLTMMVTVAVTAAGVLLITSLVCSLILL
ncbi:tetraspanin-18-like [Mastacembelus armatus]|uniref:tetraspanin-18-like n=1 Tax=Mastacembelus armatus TaxID=205130 RepID=UPI000E45CF20|nr:tetraspanin-18-like [Mastacembelus armatus]XP_026180342.1 tetraspanin-18-like [Mastacembelus armatus]